MNELKVGTKLKIFTDNGVYEGIIYAVDLKGTGKDDRVTLHKACCLSRSIQLCPLLHFYTSEIKKFEIIGAPTAVKTNINGQKLMNVCSKITPAHLKQLRNVDQEKLSFSWQLGKNETQKNSENDIAVTAQEKDESEIEYTVIDGIDETFHSSIKLLKQHSLIGLAVQGICISRRGQLCWLQVGVKKHSLLYDILAIGPESFDLGLRDILESSSIQKIVYNCRSMSDMLFHQYNVLLTNVFDIQVAEVTVFSENNGGSLPWYVNSLPISLMENLNLKEDEVFFQRARMYNREKDESVWAHRPATEEMLDAACKNVKYLCALRCVMLEKLLRDFIIGTDIYLRAHRNLSNEECEEMEKDDIPQEFFRLERRQYRTPASRQRFVQNCNSSLDPVLRVCHDGISHGRRRYSAQEQEEWFQFKGMKFRNQRSQSSGNTNVLTQK